jgi:hypothetical protein
MPTVRGVAYSWKFLAGSSDTISNRSPGPMAGYHADMREPGSELIKVAGSLGIPAEPSGIESPARGVCHQAMQTLLRFALVRFIARRQRWPRMVCDVAPAISLAGLTRPRFLSQDIAKSERGT